MKVSETLNELQIELDMFEALEGLMGNLIEGTFYTSETRPLDARTDDAVVSVSSVDANELQQGRARVNLFVQDIDNGGEAKVPNKGRLNELASRDQEVIDALNAGVKKFRFRRFAATKVRGVPTKDEHYVNIALTFKRVTFSN